MKRTLFAALAMGLLSTGAMAQAPAFRLCTGIDTGNYFKAGHILKSKASSVKVDVMSTQGSLDNLDRILRGECDGAFVQSDALLVYSARNAQAVSSLERTNVLYQEHAHLLCNREAGIGRITDLTSKNAIAVGPDGSGARTTWEAFVLADKKRYQPVQVDTRTGLRGISAVSDGSAVQCMLWVGAIGSSFMKNDAAGAGDRTVLVATDDWDMAKVAKDSRGKSVYGYSDIPAGTYPAIQPRGFLGGKDIKTITVDALFVTSSAWIGANEAAYDKVLRSFAAAAPSIKALVKPAQ